MINRYQVVDDEKIITAGDLLDRIDTLEAKNEIFKDTMNEQQEEIQMLRRQQEKERNK